MDKLHDLGKLYHSYRFFGINNQQYSKLYELNQIAKEPIITAYIAYAIGKGSKTFTELFCADGYYAMIAANLGAKAYGIDNDKDGHFKVGKEIAHRLNLNVAFIRQTIPCKVSQTDIVANVGGLYHVSNPAEILNWSYQQANRFLIVQTVVSLATHDPDYFVTPAPHWTWGSRYSRESFDKLIRSKGWNIIFSHFNELEGNKRLDDRGSAYYLVDKSK